jgi:hypothetical protein
VGPRITGYLGKFAAVEEFALQNFPQTRAKSDGCKAISCTARLAPNFHHKHIQPPLAEFCSGSCMLGTHKVQMRLRAESTVGLRKDHQLTEKPVPYIKLTI